MKVPQQHGLREEADGRSTGEGDSPAVDLDRGAESNAHVSEGAARNAIIPRRQDAACVRRCDVVENCGSETDVLEPDHAALSVQATAAGAIGAQLDVLDLNASAGVRQNAVGTRCIDDDVAGCAGIALDDQIVDVGLPMVAGTMPPAA